MPLATPLIGSDYSDTQSAFFDLLEQASGGALIPDRALERPAQLIYLPNRGEYYQSHIERVEKLDLTGHRITEHRDQLRAKRAQAEAEAKTAQAAKIAQRKATVLSDEVSPIDHYNACHTIADLLDHYGYKRAGHGTDYRSPMQTSGSHATRDMGVFWVSLSGSDYATEIGAATRNGHRCGDAFDLYRHFEHGGDYKAAVRTYSTEASLQRQPSDGDQRPFSAGFAPSSDKGEGPTGNDKLDDEGGTKNNCPKWPDPSPSLLRPELREPPTLPLRDILGPLAAEWVAATAETAGAPADYVICALFSAVGGIVGNARWVSPWRGWVEPPLIWSMCVGLPSAGKSPAMDAVLAGVRRLEKKLRTRAATDSEEWTKRQRLAKIAEQAWEIKCRKACEKGIDPPLMPDEADAGAAPHIPRLIINDGTVERIGVISEAQPKGVLQVRDELSGWLSAMEARNGGSDRAFWLEAYGGRLFTVERMGRPPLTIDRLTIGVLGGIQPDKLNDLLVKASDDGLVSRFMPTWPAPAPVARPTRFAEDAVADDAWSKLITLKMPPDEEGEPRPLFAVFDAPAACLMDEWRQKCRKWETEASGLLLSHIGKLPGAAARLSLVFAAIDYAFDDGPPPDKISKREFDRACHFVESYSLPMAQRCYAAASVPREERAARHLLSIIQSERWHRFTTRQVMRHDRQLLGSKAKLTPALGVLLDADCIRAARPEANEPTGGRPVLAFDVNPAIFGAQS